MLSRAVILHMRGSMYDRCPGTASVARPDLVLVKCPKCGEDVEVFSDEERVVCDSCGTVVFREKTPSCFDWCQYSKECREELTKTGG